MEMKDLFTRKKEDNLFEWQDGIHWHFNDSVKDENYVECDVFMKNYKPTAIRTIPRSIVQIWLKQVKDILKVIDVNCG